MYSWIQPPCSFFFIIFHVGIIDDPAGSLFSYGPSEEWRTFYDPDFVPFYEPVLQTPTCRCKPLRLVVVTASVCLI